MPDTDNFHKNGNAASSSISRRTIAKPPSVRPPRPQKTPQAAGPCSWACRRLLASPPQSERNKAPKPPTRGAWVREHVANGTGRRHCRPAPAQWFRPLRIPFGGTAHVFPRLLSPKTPQAAGPCSWACRRLSAPSPHSERNAERPPPARGVGVRLPGAEGTGRRHCRPRT